MKNIKNIIEQKNPPEDPNVLWLKDNTLYKSTSKGWVPLNESPSITEHYEDHKSTLTYTGSDGKEHTVITDGSFTPNNDGDIVITDSNNEEHTIVTEENLNEILSNGTVVPITWQELKDKRDNGQLIPGSLYRITDYQCTTSQENTQSAGHQFDIVLLALSENKLAEEGWAMEHPIDVYDVTFNDDVTLKCYIYKFNEMMCNVVSIDTLKGVAGSYGEGEDVEINGSTAVANGLASTDLTVGNIPYNYFQNSNLSAWKVWYCLDNDKSRFAWADDSVDTITRESLKVKTGGNVELIYYPPKYYDYPEMEPINIDGITYYIFINPEHENLPLLTISRIPALGDDAYSINMETGKAIKIGTIIEYQPEHLVYNGRGVIYRLIDEFNNDIKYDFKNIQFKRKLTDGQYDATNGTDTWCYTLNIWYNAMCQDASIVGNTLLNDEGFVKGVYDNKFGYVTAYDLTIEGVDTFAFALGDNLVLSFCDVDGYYYGIHSNTIGNSFYFNTIGDSFNSNTIRNNFHSNTIGNNFENNTIENAFNANTIGNAFCANIIGTYFSNNTIGDDFNSNTIGNGFGNKTISNSTWYKNYGNNGVELATKS